MKGFWDDTPAGSPFLIFKKSKMRGFVIPYHWVYLLKKNAWRIGQASWALKGWEVIKNVFTYALGDRGYRISNFYRFCLFVNKRIVYDNYCIVRFKETIANSFPNGKRKSWYYITMARVNNVSHYLMIYIFTIHNTQWTIHNSGYVHNYFSK